MWQIDTAVGTALCHCHSDQKLWQLGWKWHDGAQVEKASLDQKYKIDEAREERLGQSRSPRDIRLSCFLLIRRMNKERARQSLFLAGTSTSSQEILLRFLQGSEIQSWIPHLLKDRFAYRAEILRIYGNKPKEMKL